MTNKPPVKQISVVGTLFGNELKAWYTAVYPVAACIVLGKYVVAIHYADSRLDTITGFEIFTHTAPTVRSITLFKVNARVLPVEPILANILPIIEKKLKELSPELENSTGATHANP